MTKAQNIKPSFDELMQISDSDLEQSYYVHPKDTGLKFSVISFFLALLPIINILGLWLSIKGREQSKWEGYNTITGLLALLLNALTVIVMLSLPFILMYFVITAPYDVCSHQGAGTWLYNGDAIVCQ